MAETNKFEKFEKRDWLGITVGFFIPIILFVVILSTQRYFYQADSLYKKSLIKIGYYDKVFSPLENTCYRIHRPGDNDNSYYNDGNFDIPRKKGLSYCDLLLLPHNTPGYFVLFLFFCVFSFGFCWYRKINPFKFITTTIKSLFPFLFIFSKSKKESSSQEADEDELLKLLKAKDGHNHRNYFIWGLIIFFLLGTSLFLLIPLLLIIAN